jgi:hypothetical protein
MLILLAKFGFSLASRYGNWVHAITLQGRLRGDKDPLLLSQVTMTKNFRILRAIENASDDAEKTEDFVARNIQRAR